MWPLFSSSVMFARPTESLASEGKKAGKKHFGFIFCFRDSWITLVVADSCLPKVATNGNDNANTEELTVYIVLLASPAYMQLQHLFPIGFILNLTSPF